MSCFTNYIGILKTDTSKSGLYLYSEISLAENAGIADKQGYNNGREFALAKINDAIEIVKDETRKHLYSWFRFESVLENVKTGIFSYTFNTNPSIGYGVEVSKISSRLTKLYVERVQCLCNTSGATSIKIIDGNKTTTFAFTAVAGTTYEVQTKYKALTDEIQIVWGTAVKPDLGYVKSTTGCKCNSCGQWITVYGSDDSNNHYGIVADVNVICDIDELFCILANDLRFPILWKTCENIIDYKMKSDRINFFTLTDDIAELRLQRDEYKVKYEESFKSLLGTLPHLLKNIDQFCINCKQTRYAEVI